jgi:hypothetical protein
MQTYLSRCSAASSREYLLYKPKNVVSYRYQRYVNAFCKAVVTRDRSKLTQKKDLGDAANVKWKACLATKSDGDKKTEIERLRKITISARLIILPFQTEKLAPVIQPEQSSRTSWCSSEAVYLDMTYRPWPQI